MIIRKEILESLKPIISNFQHININLENLNKLKLPKIKPSKWNEEFIYSDGTKKSVNYLAIFSALSFCYWHEPKWHLEFENKELGGSYSLFYALKKAIDHGFDITDMDFIEKIQFDEFEKILVGNNKIRLYFLRERFEILKEIGKVLRDKFDGEFINLFEEANYDANEINRILVENFECFRDELIWQNKKLKFYKKSQEVISLIFEQFEGKSFGNIKNMQDLSVSSDYKLPQIMHALGILEYKKDLRNKIREKVILKPDSLESIEVRAATIQIGNLIVQKFNTIENYQLSNVLWTLSQNFSSKDLLPHPHIESIWV